MSVDEPAASHHALVGGRLCLDFTNTVDWHVGPRPQEYLNAYADLVAWSQHARLLDETYDQPLLAAAAAHPALATAVLQEAITFREALYGILLATLAQRSPDQPDLDVFNALRARALSHSQIASTGTGFTWRWAHDEQELGWMLWPLAHSAEELLLSPDLNQVKMCSGPDCGWLFLDTSHNHARRWCTMESCGNRAKARRHYQRTRQHPQARTDPAGSP
jgi:predicted RNA-binding Zn ribbon-like protein